MANKSHAGAHKYHRVDMGYNKVWACALEDCTHYMPKHLEFQMKNRKSLCWKCGDEFVLTAGAMLKEYPMCPLCSDDTSKMLDIFDKVVATVANKEE